MSHIALNVFPSHEWDTNQAKEDPGREPTGTLDKVTIQQDEAICNPACLLASLTSADMSGTVHWS